MNTYEFTTMVFDGEEEKIFRGYVMANYYQGAVVALTDYFDDENVCSLEIAYINELPLLIIPDGVDMSEITQENEGM